VRCLPAVVSCGCQQRIMSVSALNGSLALFGPQLRVGSSEFVFGHGVVANNVRDLPFHDLCVRQPAVHPSGLRPNGSQRRAVAGVVLVFPPFWQTRCERFFVFSLTSMRLPSLKIPGCFSKKLLQSPDASSHRVCRIGAFLRCAGRCACFRLLSMQNFVVCCLTTNSRLPMSSTLVEC